MSTSTATSAWGRRDDRVSGLRLRVSTPNRAQVPTDHTLHQFASLEVDFVTGALTVRKTTGESYAVTTAPVEERGAITAARFFVHDSRIDVSAAGHELSIDVGWLDAARPPISVYLDQNQWVNFAKWHKDPGLLEDGAREFFSELAAAVDSGSAVTPLSAAHLNETARRGGRSRVDLAAAALRYSRGWQFREMAALQRGELRALFGGAALAPSDAVTLDPHAALDEVRAPMPMGWLSDELNDLIKRLSWATALVAVLIDDQPSPSGIALAARWAASFEELAQHMRDNPKTKARRRDLTRTRFITNLGTDLPAAALAAGMSPEAFGRWLDTEAEAQISTAPGLARLREVIHLRLSNADDRWEANDLNDMVYLSFAAAYCDVVVGEKKTINYLRRADPLVPPGAALRRRPAEATADLRRLIADI